MTQVNERLLALLVCPVCHADVRQDGDRIVCGACGRRYPVRDGLAIMLADEAELPGAEAPADAASAAEDAEGAPSLGRDAGDGSASEATG
jgi:hypothetical protein